ncbi:MAG TPA: lysylphosphatidylglycerol synthase transmembrane domain-containing protein, partial [Chloroflexota bacterium]|nr:lysylphosphatidylglycerol synthase transmembrane domain-containing protein [Chloroflexota bacterium]
MSTLHGESLPSDITEVDEPDLGSRFLRPRTLISFLVGIVIVAFAISKMQVDVAGSIQIVRQANWVLYLIALLVYYTVFLSRGLRWRVMLENTGLTARQVPSVFGLGEIIYLSWFTNSILPAKLGDVYRAYLLRSRSRVSFTKAGGTIIAERILDVAILVLLLLVTALGTFRGVVPGKLVPYTEVGAIIIVLAFVCLYAVARMSADLRRIIPNRFHRVYDNLREGTVGSFGSYPALISLTVLA